MTTKVSSTRANMAGLVAISLWGALALFSDLAGRNLAPFQLLAITFSLATLVLGVGLLRSRERLLAVLKAPAKVWLLGVVGLFGYHLCYFQALDRAPAVEASLIAYLWPLLIVLFSALLPGEQLTWQHSLGAVLALAGCWLLIGDSGHGFDERYLDGYLFAVAAALVWSSYSVVSRLLKGVSSDTVVGFCLITALLGWGCHLALEETRWPAESSQWLALLGLGIGPVGIAFIAWDSAVKNGNIQLLGVLSYGAPLISTLLLLWFGDSVYRQEILYACLLIVGGALLAQFGTAAHAAKAQALAAQSSTAKRVYRE